MSADRNVGEYERAITPIERLFAYSPYSIVTLVARIRGAISEGMLRDALAQVRQRHPNLRVRIVAGEGDAPRFTSQGAGEIPVEVVARAADDHWISVVQESCQTPFDFDARPAIRFILVQSPAVSDLVILCHHILCDGLSLAYLARDLLSQLGEPGRALGPLPAFLPMTRANIPQDVSLNALVRFVIRRMNKQWAGERVVFDQEDYDALHRAYWMRYRHQALAVELTEAQTTALVERCRSRGVTVNSALTAAFVGAQAVVQDGRPHHASVGVAASLRDRLQPPVGEAMGFYAGLVTPRFKYDSRRSFWDNARGFHRTVRTLYSDKNLFSSMLVWCTLDPSILEVIHFKKLGALVPEDAPRQHKLRAFAARSDVVLSILKRDRMESLDRITMGTAVTNLTRLDFPTRYGPLELERLILKPGGAFPLANVNLVVGAVTCAGRLSLALEFVEDNIDLSAATEIKDRALAYLLGG